MKFTSTTLLALALSFASPSFAATIPEDSQLLSKRQFNIPIFNCPILTGLQCVAALGPTAVACVSAGIQEGLNPVTGIPALVACGIDVFNDIVNVPAPCETCLEDLVASLGLHF